jgi:hypothetical protein
MAQFCIVVAQPTGTQLRLPVPIQNEHIQGVSAMCHSLAQIWCPLLLNPQAHGLGWTSLLHEQAGSKGSKGTPRQIDGPSATAAATSDT